MVDKKAILEIHLQPRAKRDEVTGLVDGVLRVRVTAPPIEGKANNALIALIAELLSVSKSSVVINRGQTSRRKVMTIQGLSTEGLQEKLTLALSEKGVSPR